MRPVNFGPSFGDPNWVEGCLRDIEHASREDAMIVADEFAVAAFTPTRTLNPTTATAADVANFLATFIDTLKRRGRISE